MKNAVKKCLLMSCVLTLMVPNFANAAQVQKSTEKEINARSAIPVTATVKDNNGNRYGLIAYSIKTGKGAQVSTKFQVDYYYGGTSADVNRVNSYTKSLTAKGSVNLSGGGSNSFGSKTSKTGSSYEYITNGSYIYTVKSLTGTHGFSCNGASWSTTTLD